MTHRKHRVFNRHQLRYGLRYALKEYGIELNPTLLNALACTVYNTWSPKREQYQLDDVKSTVINYAFELDFEMRDDTDVLRKEVEAYSAAIGKMIVNRAHLRKPGYRPDERMGRKRPRTPKVVEESQGQLAVKH